MKRLMILSFFLMHLGSCNSPENQIDTISFYYQSDNDNECVFVIDNAYEYIKSWENYEFLPHSFGDSLIVNNYGKVYKKRIMKHSSFLPDSIYIANSRHELKRRQWNWLFNTKIFGLNWNVSLYSFDDTKGTYVFTISQEERTILNDLIHSINLNPKRLYPSLDTSRVQIDGPFAAIYLATFCCGEEIESFGSIEYPELSALMQFAILINQKYIKSKNRISKNITLMDVRNRFNLQRQKVVHTGSDIEDYDSVVVRIYGEKVSKDKAKE